MVSFLGLGGGGGHLLSEMFGTAGGRKTCNVWKHQGQLRLTPISAFFVCCSKVWVWWPAQADDGDPCVVVLLEGYEG